MRLDKVNYYLEIAVSVSRRGTCLRRNFGAIIVGNDEIIATGYNGAPRGRRNCVDTGSCMRQRLGIPAGQRYELCRSVHAEANCIISAPRDKMLGSTLYLACTSPDNPDVILGNVEPCSMCKRLIINAGIAVVFARDAGGGYQRFDVEQWIENDDSVLTEIPNGY